MEVLSKKDFKVTYKTNTPTITYSVDLINDTVTRLVPSVIEHMLKEKGWTQAKLAKKMGTTQSSVARAIRLEKTGKFAKISFRYYMRFCEAIGGRMTAPKFVDRETGKYI